MATSIFGIVVCLFLLAVLVVDFTNDWPPEAR